MSQQPQQNQATHLTANEPARNCRRCGYELRGLTTPRCPECGRDFDPANPRSYRRHSIHRWHWYVKRAVILLVTFIIFLAAVWSWFFWGWHDEQRLLAEMKIPPFGVVYKPIVSSWVREHLGPIGFVLDRTTWIGLYSRDDITDLSQLTQFTKLEGLDLNGTPITDISPLSRLKNLQMLSLAGTKVTDISPLAHLSKLGAITLTDTPIKDISPLSGLKFLTNISLDRTLVKDVTPLNRLGMIIIDLPKETFTEAQVEELERSFPGWIIQRK